MRRKREWKRKTENEKSTGRRMKFTHFLHIHKEKGRENGEGKGTGKGKKEKEKKKQDDRPRGERVSLPFLTSV